MIVDAYTHMLPKKYQDALEKKVTGRDMRLSTARYAKSVPTLLDLRRPGFVSWMPLRITSRWSQWLRRRSMQSPLPTWRSSSAGSQTTNWPSLFKNTLAVSLRGSRPFPMTNVDAALAEADRAIKDLRLRAVEVGSDIAGKPLDSPEFIPFYEKMVELDRPIFIHPVREMNIPDYAGEKDVQVPHRLDQAGLALCYRPGHDPIGLRRGHGKIPSLEGHYPSLRRMHAFLAGRLDWNDDFNEMAMGYRDLYLKADALTYYRRFFYDTAVNGHTAALLFAVSLSSGWIRWSLPRIFPLTIRWDAD